MTAKTEKTPNGTKIKTYRREVTFDLTHDESERYGRELASKKRQRDNVIEKAKQTAANFKGQVADLSAEIDRLAVAVDSGKELRSAEVEDWLDASQVFVYKAGDYAKPIDQRPAGFADEQTSMFDDHDKETEEKPPGDFAEPPKPAAKAKRPPRKKKTPAN